MRESHQQQKYQTEIILSLEYTEKVRPPSFELKHVICAYKKVRCHERQIHSIDDKGKE